MKNKYISSLLLGSLSALGVSAGSVSASKTADDANFRAPFETTTIACGEAVQLSGSIHMLVHVTTDAAGGTHITAHANPQGVSGVGLTSGATYHANGASISKINSGGPPPYELTEVNNFHIVGAGPASNSMVHSVLHLTVNAQGRTTATFAKTSATCG